MQFLNDKFFKVAVILFFFLMALPFMFSTPEPEKKDNTPTLEFEDKNPVYKIIDTISKFYGFKKKNEDTEFTLNDKQISQIKKQIAEKQEKQAEKNEQKNATTAAIKQAISARNADNKKLRTNPLSNTADYQETNTYVTFNNKTYEVLKDKEDRQYLDDGKTIIAMDSLPKPARKNLQQINLPFSQNYPAQDTKTAVYPNKESHLTAQRGFTDNQAPLAQAGTAFSSTPRANYQKGSISSFFKPTTKAGQDFLQNLDDNIKNIQFIKQNKTEQAQTHAKARPVYTKAYKAQVFNPTTKKMEETAVQEQIESDDIKKAEEIKRITAQSLSKQNYDMVTFKYDKQNITIPIPKKDEIDEVNALSSQAPLHILISNLDPLDSMELDKAFNSTYSKAEQKLPAKNFPLLEFVYKNNRNQILRAPNDSFNVMAISRSLANKVTLPDQSDIDFLDIKNRIYVVPEKELYQEYLSMEIPVIYYPNLSPQNLGEAYDSARTAIDTLISNKEKQLKTEQNQNKAEIENLLINRE